MRSRFASLRSRLLTVGIAAVVPLTLLAIAILLYLAMTQREAMERNMMDTVRALMIAVDNELERTQAGLRGLVESQALISGDIPTFRAEAGRVLSHFPSWANLILANSDGRQIVNMRVDSGRPLGRVADERRHALAVRTGQPVVGGVIDGPRGSKLFSVRVPVLVSGRLTYVLAAACTADGMLSVLVQQRIPAEAVVSVLDDAGMHVARSKAHEAFVGKPPSQSAQALMKGRVEGWGPTTGLEGQAFYTAFYRSSVTGWSVALGIPRSVVDEPIRRAYIALGIAVLLSAALGLAAAFRASRAITRPIAALREAARAVGRGEAPPAVNTTLPEVVEVAEALRLAQERRERVLDSEREARAAAERANRSKDELLAMLGHELRNPLGAITSGVALLDRMTAGEPQAVKDVVAMLARQSTHLARLTDDLLDVGRVVSGKIALSRRVVDLAELVEVALSTARAAGRLDRHVVRCTAHPVYVNGDPARLEQVFGNLLTNALKYTDAGGTITIDVFEEDRTAVVRVRDTGIGIEPELLPQVFGLFVQGRQPIDRGAGGLGIGLTLVQRLVALHDGSVEARSEGHGRGSEFVVRLPAVAAPPSTKAEDADSPSKARRILLVEDNEDARTTMRMLLEAQGHTVFEAVDGPGGIAAFEQHAPDIAIVDIGLPGYDGYEVARRIRTVAGNRVQLVALTGYGSERDATLASEAGFDVHLAKPCEAHALARVIAKHEIAPVKSAA